MRLEVKDGCYGYGSADLLRQVNLLCGDKETVAVLGPNGAGKSTLLRCMLGLLPWKSGATLVNGTDIRSISARVFRKQMGYVPQQHEKGLALETEEMMLLGRIGAAGLFGHPGAKDRQAVEAWMKYLGIEYLRGRRCSRISGGELQLVMIGRALVSEPSLLVLDEPEAGLDMKNQLHIFRLLKRLKDEMQLQIVFNTHRPELAYETAERVLLLNGRGESRFGETDRMLIKEQLEWAYDVEMYVDTGTVGNRRYCHVIPFEKQEDQSASEKA